jgi:hypothetical protein
VSSSPEHVVTDDEARRRYVLTVGDEEAGAADYRRDGDAVVIEHTVVDTARREKGLGTELARGALDDLRRRGLRLVPQCPFIATFVDRHPEYADLVVPEP